MNIRDMNKSITIIRVFLCCGVLLAGILAAATGSSQDLDPIRILLDARQDYNEALSQADSALFARSCRAYIDFYELQEQDAGLAKQFEEYFPLAAFKAGWCYFRLAELSGNASFLGSAKMWFETIPFDTPDSIGVYSALMAGEALFQAACLKKYANVSDGTISKGNLDNLIELVNASKGRFRQVSNRLPSGALKTYSMIRQYDADFQIASLWQLADDSTQALSVLKQIDYPQVSSSISGIGNVKPILDYSHAMVLLKKYLLTLDPYTRDTLNALLKNIGNETAFRRGHKAQADIAYNDAIAYYQQAVSQDKITESNYWLGYIELIKERLRLSRDSFERFIKAAEKDTLNNPRLKPLVIDAAQKKQIMNIALGKFVPGDFLQTMDKANMRFLIQVGASSTGAERTNCLDALERFFKVAVGLADDELNFYRGVVRSLRADAEMSQNRRVIFAKAADILEAVRGVYEAEAKYIRARCLSHAREPDSANTLLRELIRNKGSLRSLFYLAENYWDSNRFEHACAIFDRIRNAIEDKDAQAYYNIWLANAESRLNKCSTVVYSNVRLDVPGIENLKIPESLSVLTYDIKGETRTELIQYETLRDDKFIRRAFADEALYQLKRFDLPKKQIYPAQRQLNNSIFLANAFDNFSAGIPDWIPLDATWDIRLMLVGAHGRTSRMLSDCDITIVSTAERLQCSESGYYARDDFEYGESVELSISHPDYYPTLFAVTFNKIGRYWDTLALSEKAEYILTDRKKYDAETVPVESKPGENVLLASIGKPLDDPGALLHRFPARDSLRDIAAIDKSGNNFITNCRKGGKLLRLPAGSGSAGLTPFPLQFADANDSLDCPQGLAVDSDGNIYVSDWGNNRVVVYDRSGNYSYEFGDSGRNSESNIGKMARFRFPTGIVIVEDKTGITFQGAKLHREKQIFVADRYGIHRCDAGGRYLDTHAPADTSQKPDPPFLPGSFYGFSITGYGQSSKLHFVDRTRGEVLGFEVKE